ncbi:signal transduction histidine kinase [Leucobacter komagatae]|uniref:histidine kinase n=1 Tax=Leucobacter komagatae TaxID=55969 RepID=A0A542Y5B3_9MICO|nr:histidine kinase [Leucobacter komagatae]TQL43278.1 signal transduction histidine kinase [Leucobacter komagatae]
MLLALFGDALTPEVAYSRAAEGVTYTVFGVVTFLLLPIVMRALAVFDIALTRAGLGGNAAEAPAAPTAASPSDGMSLAEALPFASFTGWSWILIGFATVATIAVTWPLLVTLYEVHPAIAMVLAAAEAAAVALALRLPALAIALGTVTPAATTLITAAPIATPWPWPVTMLIVQALLAFIIGLRHDWRWVLAALALPQLAVIAAVAFSGAGFTGGAITSLVISSSVALGLGLCGIVAQRLLENRGALRAERQHSAELDAKQRELSERNVVARELHDVVAHSMSVVSIQANTAKYRIPGLGDEAEAEFEAIAQSSRQALSEMRGLLATLRDSDGTAPLAPQPTLADLPALIQSSRNSGAEINYRTAGDAPAESVLSATGLTVYRVVQESLANAMRHAPGAAIDVTVTLGDDTITVGVVNGPAPQEAPPAPGSGLGLAGLRERVTALGGSVTAGPTPAAAGEGSGSAGAGFAVSVELPR